MSVKYLENCLQLGIIADALNYVIDETFQLVDPPKMIPVFNTIVESKQCQLPLE